MTIQELYNIRDFVIKAEKDLPVRSRLPGMKRDFDHSETQTLRYLAGICSWMVAVGHITLDQAQAIVPNILEDVIFSVFNEDLG